MEGTGGGMSRKNGSLPEKVASGVLSRELYTSVLFSKYILQYGRQPPVEMNTNKQEIIA
jgi:hypothetical protein